MHKIPRPVVLTILDGWGIAPPGEGNTITGSATPAINLLGKNFPLMALQASGEAVGLPWGEMGNSEVGHLNLGAGRIVYQDMPRITRAIAEGTFYTNPVFEKAEKHRREHKSKFHLVGMVSSGGVHSSLDHLFGLLEFARRKKIPEVYIHAILDGRDAPRNSGQRFIEKLNAKIKELGIGKIASLSGRYYAMDRDNRWDREERAFNAMVEGVADRTSDDPLKAISSSYTKANYDEEFVPTVILEQGKPVATIDDGDAVVFFNFRPDRARQLTKAFVLPGFNKFKRTKKFSDLFFVTMTEYDRSLPVEVAFPPEYISMPLAKVISDAKLTQLHIAETEKYAHVTYFFNGGNEDPFPGQDNILVPSPQVSSYAEKPEMSAHEVTSRLLAELAKDKYDFIVVNYANADMVGHTGNLPATKIAVQIVDECLGKLMNDILPRGGALFVTADHGNAESKVNLQTGDMDKEHTVNPVPLYVAGEMYRGVTPYGDIAGTGDLSLLPPVGILSDVTVTVIETMGLKVPSEMTGHNLLT